MNIDNQIKAEWPERWRRANDPGKRGASKRRNKIRRAFKDWMAANQWRAENSTARCFDCAHREIIQSRGIATCELGEEKGGWYQPITHKDAWCTSFVPVPTEDSNA